MIFFGGISWVYHQSAIFVIVYDQNACLISKSSLGVSNFTDGSFKLSNLFLALNRQKDDCFIFAFDDESLLQQCKKAFLNYSNLFLIYADNLVNLDVFKCANIYNPEHLFLNAFFCSIIAAFESYSLLNVS